MSMSRAMLKPLQSCREQHMSGHVVSVVGQTTAAAICPPFPTLLQFISQQQQDTHMRCMPQSKAKRVKYKKVRSRAWKKSRSAC